MRQASTLSSMNSMLFPATPRRNSEASYAIACLCTPRCDDPRTALDPSPRTSNRLSMTRDETDFRIRPGKPRDHQPRPPRVRRKSQGFLAEVHQAVRRAGGDPNRLAGKGKASGRFNARGRGAKVAAELKGRNPWSRGPDGSRLRARRVTVKARIVKLNPRRGARAVRRQRQGGRRTSALPRARRRHARRRARPGLFRD